MVPPDKMKGVELDAEQVSEALDESLRMTTLPTGEGSEDKPATAMVLREDDAKDLETLLESVEALDPAAKQHFVDALVAKHYGIEKRTDGQKDVVPYSEFEEDLYRSVRDDGNLSKMIWNYAGADLLDRHSMGNLRFLVGASVLEQTGFDIYVGALKRLHRALKKGYLQNDVQYAAHNRTINHWARYVTLNAGGAAVSLALLNPLPIICTALVGFVGEFISYTVAEDSPRKYFPRESVKVAYLVALDKHRTKRCKTLHLDLEVASDYCDRLLEQLSEPRQMDKAYLDRLSEVHTRIESAKEYFKSAKQRFKSLKDKH